MSEYRIAAIPTEYKGRKYRSRLEARWAAFFDLLGWRHEYEPFDLGKWSPDFLLTGRYGATLLVEVKPIQQFSAAVASKIVEACFAKGIQDEVSGYLLLGVAPSVTHGIVTAGWAASPQSDQPLAEWKAALIGWIPGSERPSFTAELLRVHRWQMRSGAEPETVIESVLDDAWPAPSKVQDYAEHTMRLWAQATNLVQWQPA